MSPNAFHVLSAAYENYLKTGDTFFQYQPCNQDDQCNAIIGAKQLYEDGLIDEVSDFVLAFHVVARNLCPICLHITKVGVEYIRRKRESDCDTLAGEKSQI